MAKAFYFDCGIDPAYRLASSSDELNEEKTMLRMSRFSEHRSLPVPLDAKILPLTPDVTEHTALELAASVLRDCYGKINVLLLPTAYPVLLNSTAKMAKAYRKNIHVIAVTLLSEAEGFFPAALPEEANLKYIDEAVSVSIIDASKTAELAEKLEGITIDNISGAVLYAAADAAAQIKNKHARVVPFLFTERKASAK